MPIERDTGVEVPAVQNATNGRSAVDDKIATSAGYALSQMPLKRNEELIGWPTGTAHKPRRLFNEFESVNFNSGIHFCAYNPLRPLRLLEPFPP